MQYFLFSIKLLITSKTIKKSKIMTEKSADGIDYRTRAKRIK